MSRPDTYENTFRAYDGAIHDWLSTLIVDYGTVREKFGTVRQHQSTLEPIIVVQATPERLASSVGQTLVRRGWMQDHQETDRLQNWPLPIASFYRMGPLYRPAMQHSPGRYKHLLRDHKGNWLGADYPTPLEIPYEITFWCLKRYTEAHILEWITKQIGRRGAAANEFYITVDHDRFPDDIIYSGVPVYGRKLHSVHVDAITDVSDVEQAEIDVRTLRLSLLITVRGWVFHPLTPSEGGVAVEIDTQCERELTEDENSFFSGRRFESLGIGVTTSNLLNYTGAPYFELSDGMTAKYDEASQGKELHRFVLTAPSGGGSAQTIWHFPYPLLRIDDPTVLQLRLDYRFPTINGDVFLEVLGVTWDVDSPGDPVARYIPSYHVVQRHKLEYVSGKWNRLERWAAVKDDVAFRFVFTDETVMEAQNVSFIIRHANWQQNEYVTDADMQAPDTSAWTPIGFPSLTKTTVNGVQGLSVAVTVPGDGVSQEIEITDTVGFVLLLGRILQISGQWRILLDNDATAPTDTVTLDIGENWENFGLVSAPLPPNNKMKARIEALTANASITLRSLSLREFTAPVYGTHIPL